MELLITIFTPTYNRASMLGDLFSSLLNQENKNFEWLIIDDGSTDSTQEIVEEWMRQEKKIPIRYYKVENGGKQRAINKALDLANGKLFFIVDSDDTLTKDSTDKIQHYYNSIKNQKSIKFAGVAGLKGYPNGKLIGSTFEGEVVDLLAFQTKKHGITGDKAEVYYTSILKEFKTPEIEGEKFIPEEIYHYRIASNGYRMRYFNSIIYNAEYLDDGYSRNINKVLYNNFKGYTIRCKELLTYDVGLKRKIEVIGKYSLMAEKKEIGMKEVKRELDTRYPTFFIWGVKVLAKLHYKLKKQRMEV